MTVKATSWQRDKRFDEQRNSSAEDTFQLSMQNNNVKSQFLCIL